jgi:hypothetical protein
MNRRTYLSDGRNGASRDRAVGDGDGLALRIDGVFRVDRQS